MLEEPPWARSAVGAEPGLYGMRLEMSPFGEWLLITHCTRQTRAPRCLKESEDEKHFGPSQKEINFPLETSAVNTTPPALCSACGIQHSSPFIWCLSTTLQIVLWGNFLLRVTWTFIFPVLINDVAGKDYFFSGLANIISYLVAYWEHYWKKHGNIF